MPTTPTFDGVAMFGERYHSFAVRPDPVRLQYNAYTAVNGLEAINHGHNGYTTVAEFLLHGVNDSDLALQEVALMAYVQSALSSTLFDTMNRIWLNVIMVDAQPLEEVSADGELPECSRLWQATFKHLL